MSFTEEMMSFWKKSQITYSLSTDCCVESKILSRQWNKKNCHNNHPSSFSVKSKIKSFSMKIHVFLLSLNSQVYFLMKKKMSEPDEVFLWRKICLSWRKKNMSFVKKKSVFRTKKNWCLSLILKWIGYFMNVFHFHQNEEEILSFIIVIIQPQDYVFRKTRNKLSFRRMIKKRKKIKRTKKCLSETPQVFLNITMNKKKSFIHFIIRLPHSSW